MQGFDPIFIVVVVIALVAAATISYRPTGYRGPWKILAAAFESDRRPMSTRFRNESLLVDSYTHFDVEIDNEFLWLIYDGPSPPKCPPCLQIPLKKIRFERNVKEDFHFFAEAAVPVRFETRRTLGEALARRVGQAGEAPE